MAITAFSMPGPRAAAKASASTRRGNARKMSVMRISTVSAAPPKYPAGRPMARPTGTTITPTMATMVSVMREPNTTRAKMSRPSSSVPNQMLPARRLQPVRQHLQGGGLPIGDQRGEDRHQHQQQYDAKSAHRQRIAAEAQPGAEPAAEARLRPAGGRRTQQPRTCRARDRCSGHH